MADLTFKIASDLEEAGFKDAAEHVRKVGGETKKTGEESKKAAKGVDKLQLAYSAMVGLGVLAFFKDAVDESARNEQAMFLLQQRVENTTLAWDKAASKVEAFTSAIEQTTRFSSEEAANALSTLTDNTGDLRQAQELMNSTMGLAIARNMDLAAAAEIVGGTAAGVQGKMGELAEVMGQDASKAKDLDKLLGDLDSRFGKLATNEDTLIAKQKKFGNQLNNFKDQVGDFFRPAVGEVMDAIGRLLKVLDHAVAAWVAGWVAMWNAVTLKFGEAKSSMKLVQQELGLALDAIAGKLDGVGDATDNLVDKTKVKGKELSEEYLNLIATLNAETNKLMAGGFEQELAALDSQYEAKLEKMIESMNRERIAKEEQQRILSAMDANHEAKQFAIAKTHFQKRAALYAKFGTILGVTTAKMLAGDVSAWKTAAGQVIDIVASETSAIVMSRAIAGAGQEVAKKGYAGLITGAGLIAWGAAKVAVIQGLAQAAKGALTGGGGASTAPTGGGGGASPGGYEPVSTPAAAPAATQKSVIVDVRGDFYGEPAFVDRLAERISEAVEDRDVRLVSRQVVTD